MFSRSVSLIYRSRCCAASTARPRWTAGRAIISSYQRYSSPPVQKCCAEMMSVSVAGIQKNRCRTTVAEPMVETLSETALYRDQVGLFKAQPGRTEADLALSGQAGPSASRQFFARE